jgi:hypothetical protein
MKTFTVQKLKQWKIGKFLVEQLLNTHLLCRTKFSHILRKMLKVKTIKILPSTDPNNTAGTGYMTGGDIPWSTYYFPKTN